MPGGRPRGFDLDTALDRALELFWRNGYDGTSVADLTAALGIAKPSLYAAFGSKELLLARVLQRYVDGPGAATGRAVAEPTAHAVATSLVEAAIALTAGEGTPRGCLSVKCAQAHDDAARALAERHRSAAELALRVRLEAARREGDLPADEDPADLARFLVTLTDGIAVRAAGGEAADELRRTAAVALRAWPAARPPGAARSGA
ncbi:TetR/AcrR family transcriptional regulator [Saccharothrix sp. Mg75]|uniref:TetR/AcrR family transcriptional regulator n=1 Tax=Saccharothrix sp. Mg75 TaxID=3445357 RepID=UPI003EEEC9E5